MSIPLQHPLVLASGSPRRKELLANAGFEFDIELLEVDESVPNNIDLKELAEYLARKKNNAYRHLRPEAIILTADTVVLLNSELLEKPSDRTEAIAMLEKLSGQTHQVITGVCLRYQEALDSFSVSTEVEFDNLSNDEITYYVDNYKPFDKAGAYGIQEWIGQIGIKRIDGSYYNVVGLPIRSVYRHLQPYFK